MEVYEYTLDNSKKIFLYIDQETFLGSPERIKIIGSRGQTVFMTLCFMFLLPRTLFWPNNYNIRRNLIYRGGRIELRLLKCQEGQFEMFWPGTTLGMYLPATLLIVFNVQLKVIPGYLVENRV